MSMHCRRYVSNSLGVALGYLYFYAFGVIGAYEVVAATIIIDYWPSGVHVAVWLTIMIAVIVVLNVFPVRVYAEAEFWFASIKVVLILGLLLLSLVLMLGGGPGHDRLGFRYWYDPGAVNEYILPGAKGRFVAFIYVWILCGFSFYFGPELVIVTSGEMRNPRRNLPVASRQFFYRLIFFYVLSASLFMLLAYMACSAEASTVFNWFISITNSAGYTSWVLCCVTFIRFRKACRAQGVVPPYQSRIQPWAAWVCMILFAVLCMLNGFTNFFPGHWSTGNFLSSYIGVPVFLAIWLIHKFTIGRKDPWMYKPENVDLTTGLDVIEADVAMYQEEESSRTEKKGLFQSVRQKLTRGA